jgi:predicted ATPase
MSPIGEVAGGNPLFIEELLSMLIEEGDLIRDGGQWTTRNDLRDITIPPASRRSSRHGWTGSTTSIDV